MEIGVVPLPVVSTKVIVSLAAEAPVSAVKVADRLTVTPVSVPVEEAVKGSICVE